MTAAKRSTGWSGFCKAGLACLALVAFLPKASWGQDAPDSSDAPTLIIVGTGINAAIGGPHAKGDQMLYNTLQMFHAGQRKLRPTSVRFDGNFAHFQSTFPDVDLQSGRFTGSHREDVDYPADVDNHAQMVDAAETVGGEVARNPGAVLSIDMDLQGNSIIAGKGIATILAKAANSVRDSLPGVDTAYHLSLAASGQQQAPPPDFQQHVDDVRTAWNTETERAAVFMEVAAREFKKKYGPNAKVILVGHSAFNDAINMVPMRDGKKRLIDLRILSSERSPPPLREKDERERTIFITHEDDLGPTYMGNRLSPRLHGEDLQGYGTIITLRGDSYMSWQPSASIAMAAASSPTAALMLRAIAGVHRALDAHTATHLYETTFDMTITSGGKSVRMVGKPGDVIDSIANQVFASNGVPAGAAARVMSEIEKKAAKETPVGGISLTKPADLPVEPGEVRLLDVDEGSHPRLVLVLRDQERLRLPATDPGTLAAAYACVYGQGRGPELSLEVANINGRRVYNVRYPCLAAARTPLGTDMLVADRALGSMALGTDQDYSPPPIANYQPFAEAALDDHRINEGLLTGRVWLLPSTVTLARSGDDLTLSNLVTTVRLEFWKPDQTAEYYRGASVGVRTPAGDYVGARLSQAINNRPDEFPAFAALRVPAAVVGTLLWAHNHGVMASTRLTGYADSELGIAHASYQLPYPAREVEYEGNLYHVLPLAASRDVSEDAIARPAVIFGPYGPTRFLWDDGTQSTLQYRDGHVVRLVGRDGRVGRIMYDDMGRVRALGTMDGRGIAIFPQDKFSLVAPDVSINWVASTVDVPRRDPLLPTASIEGFVAGRIALWLAGQQSGTPTDSWLKLAAPVEEPAWPGPALLAFVAVLLVFIAWRWRDRAALFWARRQLHSPHAENQSCGVETLAARDDASSIQALSDYLHQDGWSNSERAIRTVGEQGGTAAVAALINAVPDQSSGRSAEHMLDEIDDNWRARPEAERTLADLLRQGDAVRASDNELAAWIRAVSHFKSPQALPDLVRALEARDYVRGTAIDALKAIGVPAAPALIELLDMEGDDRRRAALSILQGIPGWGNLPEAKQAVPRLLAALGHRYSLLREDAARALGQIGDKRALHPLLNALEDVKQRVRSAAVTALGDLGDSRALPRLQELFAEDPSALLAAALEQLGDHSTGVLHVLETHPEPALRQRALEILASEFDEQDKQEPVLEVVFTGLVDPNTKVHEAALSALLAIPAAWRQSPAMKAAVQRLVAGCGAKGTDRHWKVLATLRALGNAVVPMLEGIHNPAPCSIVTEVLTDLKTPDVLPRIREELRVARTENQTTLLIKALGEAADADAVDDLLPFLAENNYCFSAAAALQFILKKRAGRLSETQLQGLAALADRDWIEVIPYTGPCNLEDESYTRTLDLGPLRQLARQELIRRGLKA